MLRAADLYWVTGDMAAQALDASQDVPGFTTADLPSPSGLVLFQAQLPDIDTPQLTLTDGTVWAGRVPVWGLWWHPRSADQLVVEVLTHNEPGPARRPGHHHRPTPTTSRTRNNQPSSNPGREYRHRWIVRGHWTHQPHGPRNSLRKLTYRAPYIKGPPDAPLLATQKVMVWRR